MSSYARTAIHADSCFRNALAGLFLLALVWTLAAPGPAWAGQKPLDDFGQQKEGSFPEGWKARIDDPQTTYVIRQDPGGAYLEAKSNGGPAVQMGKKMYYLLEEYPFLTWEWRVVKQPKGGDERDKKTSDSAAALYVIMDGKGLAKKWPRTVKYVWSASLPVGSRLTSPYDPKTRMVVLRNQETPLGKWVSEKVNVLKDLEEFFPKDKGKVRGFAFMTDSDNTKSATEAGIRKITISSE